MGNQAFSGTGTLMPELGAMAAAIPGKYLSRKDVSGAGEALERLGKAAGTGALPMSETDPRANAEGTLWLIRASHLFAKAGGDPELAARLLEISKRSLQEFISAKGLGGVTMDNGGMLVPSPDQPGSDVLRLNALWYSALESTAADLNAVKAGSGDHFERLAGRFRRTFAKAYWCEGHNCVCPPHVRAEGTHGPIPVADQLLLTILPASPVPRTKQRQLVQAVREKADGVGRMGILVDHPTLGRVESVLHRAWLALGILNSTDNRSSAMAEAQSVLRPLTPVMSNGRGVAAYYKDGAAIGAATDPLATSEVLGVLEIIGEA